MDRIRRELRDAEAGRRRACVTTGPCSTGEGNRRWAMDAVGRMARYRGIPCNHCLYGEPRNFMVNVTHKFE